MILLIRAFTKLRFDFEVIYPKFLFNLSWNYRKRFQLEISCNHYKELFFCTEIFHSFNCC